MNFCIVYHPKDEAAVNIITQLKKLAPSLPIYSFEEKEHIIFHNHLDQKVKEDFIIFASKHQSTQHNKTLTIHSIGNFRKAEFGGYDGKLCNASAFVNKLLFKELLRQSSNSRYQCTLEATHHGPYIEKPSCFIELGSTQEEWTDMKGGEIIAKAIQEFAENFQDKNTRELIPAVGIGAGHYCPSFTKLQSESPYAISHVLPQYHMPFTEEMILELLNKTTERATIILDWKGVGNAEERKHLLKILEKLNLLYLRTDHIEK